MTEWRRLRRLCRVSNLRHSANYSSLPSVKVRALGKVSSFAEYQSSGTRQSFFLCRVSCSMHPAKLLPLPCVKIQALDKHIPECIEFGFFAECHSADTRQRSHFSPRMYRFWPRVRFAECFCVGTRQKASLPSVTLGKAATYNQFIRFGHSHVPHSNKHHIHHR